MKLSVLELLRRDRDADVRIVTRVDVGEFRGSVEEFVTFVDQAVRATTPGLARVLVISCDLGKVNMTYPTLSVEELQENIGLTLHGGRPCAEARPLSLGLWAQIPARLQAGPPDLLGSRAERW